MMTALKMAEIFNLQALMEGKKEMTEVSKSSIWKLKN